MTEMFGEAWSPMSVPDLAPDDDDDILFLYRYKFIFHSFFFFILFYLLFFHVHVYTVRAYFTHSFSLFYSIFVYSFSLLYTVPAWVGLYRVVSLCVRVCLCADVLSLSCVCQSVTILDG